MEILKLEDHEMLGNKKGVPLMSPNEGWLAGGAVRAAFVGDEKIEDYDYFFKTEAAREAFQKKCIESGYQLVFENENCVNFLFSGRKFQLVKKYYPTLEALFDAFDFHLCQFAQDENGQSFATKKAVISVLRKHLSINRFQSGYELDSLRRAFKYFGKGYRPCMGVLRDIAKNLGFDMAKIDAQTMFYPDGSERFIRFD